MQTASIKTTLSVIFACVVLILTFNGISREIMEQVEPSDIITEVDDEIADEPIIPETEIETKVEVEVDVKTEVEVEPLFYLSDYERWITECVVMGESGAESYEGQVLVAQCLLNGCIKEDVQPSKLRTKYKYSGWNESPTDSVKEAVSAVFDDGYKITDEFILYFYAPKYSKGKWHETQRFIIEEGNHRFFAGWTD